MKEPPLRSRATDLTDDELLLCDLVFDRCWDYRASRSNANSSSTSAPSLALEGLSAVLSRFSPNSRPFLRHVRTQRLGLLQCLSNMVAGSGRVIKLRCRHAKAADVSGQYDSLDILNSLR